MIMGTCSKKDGMSSSECGPSSGPSWPDGAGAGEETGGGGEWVGTMGMVTAAWTSNDWGWGFGED